MTLGLLELKALVSTFEKMRMIYIWEAFSNLYVNRKTKGIIYT